MPIITATRYHDFSYGHRVVGHENKCVGLHGHNGRVHFECEGEADALGRVIDFGVIKAKLCDWVEDRWDHKMILWENDPLLYFFSHRKEHVLLAQEEKDSVQAALAAVHVVPFNPTAENMAQYLLDVVGPAALHGTGVYLRSVCVEETRKCKATARLRGII